MKKLVLVGLAKLPYRFIYKLSNLLLKLLGVGRIPTIQEEVKFLGSLVNDLGEFVFLDVGANVGAYSLEFLREYPKTCVFAFEPGSSAFSTLKTKTSATSINCINLGIGEKEGKFELFCDYPGSGLASLSRRDLSHLKIDFNSKEIISVVTLDNWIGENEISENIVMKMDIEGHELFALKGAVKSLKEKVKLIQFEFGGSNIDSKTYFIDFWRLLSSDFDIFRLTSKGLKVVQNYSEICEIFLNTTYYAKRKTYN